MRLRYKAGISAASLVAAAGAGLALGKMQERRKGLLDKLRDELNKH